MLVAFFIGRKTPQTALGDKNRVTAYPTGRNHGLPRFESSRFEQGDKPAFFFGRQPNVFGDILQDKLVLHGVLKFSASPAATKIAAAKTVFFFRSGTRLVGNGLFNQLLLNFL